MTDRSKPRITSATLALALALAGCSTTPSLVRGPYFDASVEVPSEISHEQAQDVTIAALGLVGTPYRYGGNTPASGFDCSGLIDYVFETRAGVALPRTVERLQHWGQSVSRDQLRSGDLVFFGRRDAATHAGIYVGDGSFVHAPSTGGTVRLDQLDSKYWSGQRVAFRRP
jgi:cell wall-associated NlpC family hydrolase